MSAFTSAEIPGMSKYCDQSGFWVTNFVLTTMLRVKLKDPARQYIFNYLRRAEAAYRQHDLARQATTNFLDGSRDGVSRYMMAVFHWEIFLAQAWQAYDLLRHFFGSEVFQRNDGSIEQRLHALYSQSKHSEDIIRSGNLPEDATIPLWMTNDGLSSKDTQLSYVETAEVLKDLAKWAQGLQDPVTFADKLREDGRGLP